MRNMMIAELLFNRPLMISESKLNVILHVLGPRMNLDLSGMPKQETAVLSDDDRRRAGYRVNDGIAIIGIYGPLLNRVLRSEFPSGGPTTYADIRSSFDMAMADDGVREIKMEIDSPGGDVSGAFDLADHIYESRNVKPVTAVVNESAFSAGYLLASAAGKIALPRTANVGSIGVIMTHADFSRAEDEAGITVTHIFAGTKKAHFSPHQPLADEAHADATSIVNSTYDLFVSTVARNRNISEAVVRGTEAGIFRAQKAVEMGLADEIMPAAKAMNTRHMPKMPIKNSNQSVTGGKASAEISQEDKKMTLEELKEQYPALYSAVFDAGATAERARIQGVLSLPGAAAMAHKDLVTGLAFDGQTTAAEAAHQVLMAEDQMRLSAAKDIVEGAVAPAPAAAAEGASEVEALQTTEAKSLSDKMIAQANEGR